MNQQQLQEVFWPEPYYSGPRPRICGRRKIEAALRAALAQGEPESVPQVARRFGYSVSGAFFKPFPALCRGHLPENRTPEGSSNSSHATDGQESFETDFPAYIARLDRSAKENYII